MAHFLLSAFADEAAVDIHAQIEQCKKHGISYIELRNYELNGKKHNISTITLDEAKELKAILDEANIGISAIGSHYGKIEITDNFEPHFEAFKNTVEAAKLLGAKYIRIFSFFMKPDISFASCKDEVIRRVKAMAEYAYERGVLCCHENEKDIYGDISDRCLELFDALGSKLGGIFDPSNCIQCGENTLEAYAKVKDKLTYLHIKDCNAADDMVVPCGEGDGHIAEIVADFDKCKDGDRFLTLEPHLKVFDGLLALERNTNVVKQTSKREFKTTEESFAAAVCALKQTLDGIGVNY